MKETNKDSESIGITTKYNILYRYTDTKEKRKRTMTCKHTVQIEIHIAFYPRYKRHLKK